MDMADAAEMAAVADVANVVDVADEKDPDCAMLVCRERSGPGWRVTTSGRSFLAQKSTQARAIAPETCSRTAGQAWSWSRTSR